MEAQITEFLNDLRWVELGAGKSELLERSVVQKHFADWCQKNGVKNKSSEVFFALMEYKFLQMYGLKASIGSDYKIMYEGLRLMVGGKRRVAPKKVDHEVDLCSCLRDGSYFTLSAKGRIVRSALYPIYLRWCESKGREPLGKIRLFELMNTRESVLKLGVRRGHMNGSIHVYRGISPADEL